MNAKHLHKLLLRSAKHQKATTVKTFFKTGPGDYAHGDVFIGVTMPEIRKIAAAHSHTPHFELTPLLKSPIHEARMLALVILTNQFKTAKKMKDLKLLRQSFNFYLEHRQAVNNWDLVDITAPTIIGGYLIDRKRDLLLKFSRSKSIWERRIAIVSTLFFIRSGDYQDTLTIAKVLLKDDHDLIHKATGWMLREIGKKDVKILTDFLDEHSSEMPRTMLRYAIERLPSEKRTKLLMR